MTITITRDKLPNETETPTYKLTLDKSTNMQQLELEILNTNILPTYEDIIWNLSNDELYSIMQFFAHGNKIFNAAFTHKIDELPSNYYATLYCTRYEYGKKLLENFKGSHYHLWHDGWSDIYEYCEISSDEEKKIIEEINNKHR